MISIETARDGFILTADGRRVLKHSATLPCVRIAAARQRVRQNRGSFSLSSHAAVSKELGAFKVHYRGSDRTVIEFGGVLTMTVLEEKGILRMSFSCTDPSVNRFFLKLGAVRGERIYGCGEQFSRLDLKGRRVPLWVEEQGIGRGHDAITLAATLRAGAGGTWHTTCFPMPAYLSSQGYWAVVDTDCRTIFNFTEDHTAIECWGIPASIAMGFKASLPPLLGGLSAETGRQKEPPEWTWNGAILGVQGGSAVLEERLKATEEAGASVAALWVQDWCGTRVTSFGRQVMWNWQADTDSYPDLPRTIRKLRERGIRFLGYINPFLATDGSLYKEASERGYCVKRQGGGDYCITITTFPAAMVDLTNPQARRWMKSLIKTRMLDIGMSGWMADFAEYLPVDAVLHSGEDPMAAHNRWPVLWAALNREACLEWELSAVLDPGGEPARASDILVFVRSGWLGTSGTGVSVWAADQLPNFSKDDGLPSVIPAALSLGFSGLGFWHSDIGGYTTVAWIKRSPRCLARWMELAAFSPLFRTHEGSRPESNVQVWSNSPMRMLFARFSDIFAALKPYHRSVASEYTRLGLPAIRHPCVHYEDDPALIPETRQYLYGRDLLVAPVLSEKSMSRVLVLPEDEWIHLWSSRRFRGGKIEIEAPFGYPPVFYRASSPFAALFDSIRKTGKKV